MYACIFVLAGSGMTIFCIEVAPAGVPHNHVICARNLKSIHLISESLMAAISQGDLDR